MGNDRLSADLDNLSARYLQVWIDQEELKIASARPVGRMALFVKEIIYKMLNRSKPALKS